MTTPKFTSMGCRLNAYETEAMKELVAQVGLEGAVIVNTCAVTAEAVRKSRQEIRKLRRENPHAKMIVTGCAAQTAPQTFPLNYPALHCTTRRNISLHTLRLHGPLSP